MGRTLLPVAGVLLALVGALLPFAARVPDDEMSPSLLAGDVVLLLPLTPRAGDVVAVVDPLDPGRWTLRRLVATSGNVRHDGGGYTVDGVAPRVLEMGTWERAVAPGGPSDGAAMQPRRVLQEGDHLVQLLSRPVRNEPLEATLAEGDLWLGADARDEALDSRWWGPAPAAQVQGVVVARVGLPGHRWRTFFAGRG